MSSPAIRQGITVNGELAIWMYESVVDSDGIQTAAELLTEGGEALFEYVMEQREDRLHAESEEHDSYIKAFGYVNAPDTPQAFRAAFAGYCVVNNIGTVDFLSQCDQFARDAEFLTDDGLDLEGLDFDLDENPFDDDELSNEHADVLFRVRLLGYEGDFDASEIEDTDSFLDWLLETGDPEAAISAHLFEPGIPSFVIENALPADRWSALNPGDISHRDCLICGHTHYQIETEDGVEWVSDTGTVGRSVDTSDERGEVYNTRYERDAPITSICPNCIDDVESEDNHLLVAIGDDTTYHAMRTGNFLWQYGNANIADLGGAIRQKVEALANGPGGTVQSWYNVNSEFSQPTNEAIADWLANNDPEVDVPLVFRSRMGGQRLEVHFPASDAQAVKAAKEFTSRSDWCALKEQLVEETDLDESDLTNQDDIPEVMAA